MRVGAFGGVVYKTKLLNKHTDPTQTRVGFYFARVRQCSARDLKSLWMRTRFPPSAPSFTESQLLRLTALPAKQTVPSGMDIVRSALRHIGKLTQQGLSPDWKSVSTARCRIRVPNFPPVLEARAMVLTALEKQRMVLSHEGVRFSPLPPV